MQFLTISAPGPGTSSKRAKLSKEFTTNVFEIRFLIFHNIFLKFILFFKAGIIYVKLMFTRR